MVASPRLNGLSDQVRCGVEVPSPEGSMGTIEV
jgi:hypothetical protein